MTYLELLDKIKENKVPSSLYSINQGLRPNAYVIHENYGIWEFFFLDERGARNNQRAFSSAESAYDYLWERLLFELRYPPSEPPDSI